MAAKIGRYENSDIFAFGVSYGTSYISRQIIEGIANGSIKYSESYLQQGERLDVLAGQAYGDGRLYWVICAASGIGFASQVPPGTIIKTPNLPDAIRYISNNQ